jgi:hypothetical protein
LTSFGFVPPVAQLRETNFVRKPPSDGSSPRFLSSPRTLPCRCNPGPDRLSRALHGPRNRSFARDSPWSTALEGADQLETLCVNVSRRSQTENVLLGSVAVASFELALER